SDSICLTKTFMQPTTSNYLQISLFPQGSSLTKIYLCNMKIKFICIGKTGKDFLEKGEAEYLGRLKHYLSIDRIEIPDLKNTKKLTIDRVKELEGKELLQKVAEGEQLYLLDENGKELSSTEFAGFLQQRFNSGGKAINFAVGGAYGFSEEVYASAQGRISLSRMTFSHQMVRMIFFEQLYRAMTILKGEPYHHQ
ncbi:MAG: 23S rRNA (pseudouridine(1915)-N(3))-methyltransferase RlmH, partial [Bacteroidota bacterium]